MRRVIAMRRLLLSQRHSEHDQRGSADGQQDQFRLGRLGRVRIAHPALPEGPRTRFDGGNPERAGEFNVRP